MTGAHVTPFQPKFMRVGVLTAALQELTPRDVRDGDSLPVLAYEIYGNPELYLEVARVNKLVNFRKLRSATRVAFPPVEAKA